MKHILWMAGCLQCGLWAQEAPSGFELRGSASEAAFYTHEFAEDPRGGGPLNGGFRSILYPGWKLNEHWAVSGAVQIHSRPYFSDEFYSQGYGLKTDILHANLSYTRFWNGGSVVVRLGQLTSAFGSFLPRYDDAVNPLVDVPIPYGYFGKEVSTLGLAGAQMDATLGKLDMRAQFVNSSPANRLSVFDRDQYGNWAGGLGYTPRQGFRVGISAYRGPYLDRRYGFFTPGRARPRDLPGSGYGLDVQWAHGPWNVYGELQRFQFANGAIATANEHAGYVEARRVLSPRWYVAARLGYIREGSVDEDHQAYEVVAGFRPNRYQLVKAGYQIKQGGDNRGTLGNTVELQFVTTFRAISIARD